VVARDSVLQDVLVEEHERVERLVLRRCRQVTLADEVVEERFDVRRSEPLRRHPPPVSGCGKGEKPANPLPVDLGRPP
jgi:hypothetical protein